MQKSRLISITCIALALALAAYAFTKRQRAETRLVQAAAASVATPPPAPPMDVVHLTVPRGAIFGNVLAAAGVDNETVRQVIAAAQPVMNFRRLREGQEIILVRSHAGRLESLRYHPDPADEIILARNGEAFTAEKREIPVTSDIVTVTGKVDTSLFDAVIAAGESPELAVRLADIFAWDLDFYTDPRAGDTFRLVFERRRYAGSDHSDYGQIFAAEYDNGGHPYQAVLFHDPNGAPAYYAADGKSLQKAFLRSPLKFAARISSHYSTHRFHPVLKLYRAHLGTDYAAPIGTPVQAIANGRVEFAGRKAADGNMVVLHHSNGYETYYLHLSRILVRRGQSVLQGQLIGRVGMTGLATGPHLDFRVRRAGAFVNFERMHLPPARPVAQADMHEFEMVRDKWIGELTGSRAVVAQASAPVSQSAGQP